MSRLALLTLLASGCFYTDPINQRPSADIIPKMSGDLYRGAMVELDAKTYDPEGQEVSVAWRVYMCTDATTPDRGAPPIVTGTVPATSTPGPFYLGIYAIPAGAAADIWFDDVALAGQHVGCE